MAFAGRALRIKIDTGGGTAAVIVGSTNDNFSVTRAGIEVTNKDDGANRTYIDDALGAWSMDGGVSAVMEDDDYAGLFASSNTQFTYDCEVDLAGLGTYAGKFGLTSFNVTGEDGENAVTFELNIASSGAITYTAAP